VSSTTDFTSEERQAIVEKPTIVHLLGLALGMVGIAALASRSLREYPVWTVVWTVATAFGMLCFTSCLHETVHQTLSRWRWVNVWLGRIIGMIIFVPYTAYRETHIRHHAYLNTPRDWELWPYASPDASLAFRRLFVVFDLLFGLLGSAIVYGRIYFSKKSPIKSQPIRGAIRNEYLLSIAFWTGIAIWVVSQDAGLVFVRCWLIPAIIAGWLQTGRKLTEHLGMSSYDPMRGTRTVVGSWWTTRLASLLNFDIFVHGPHHRHPRMPHTALAGKMQEYQKTSDDYPVYSSYWRATAAMLPYFFRNPGSGVNAGGGPPPGTKTEDVDNFVGDVVSEV
jgi:fatty acid desaturase